jgi:hypothetical protein
MKRLLLLALVLGSAACERGPEEVPAEVQAARTEARRRACLSAELARAAEEDLQTLRETFDAVGAGPAETLTRRAAQAAAEYAEAYRQHALLRQVAAANADSALNQAASPADSLRYQQQADRFVISAPEPGTIEANVIADYERKLAALLADEDHPCNWDLEE